MNIRALIVDDESKSRGLLKGFCENFCENLTVVGTVASVDEAIEQVELMNPHLVFLDIQMPVKNGFELLQHYDDVPFDVVFTTAYDEFAIKAFQYTAVDYLLKPINVDELLEAVERVRQRVERKENRNLLELKKQLKEKQFKKIALSTVDGFTFVNIADILRCEAEGNYTKIYLKGGRSELITKTLKHYEEVLADFNFFRVHKSHLINLDCVRRYTKGRQGVIEMNDGALVEVSLRKKEMLLAELDTSSATKEG